MDDEERERRRRTIEQARATLERTADVVVERRDYLAEALARPVTHQNDRDRAELAKRDAAWVRERERKAASAPAAINWAEVDRRCQAAAREAALAVAREAADVMKRERTAARRDLADEVKSLRLVLSAASETIDELRRVVASSNRSGSGEIIDLPVSRRN